MPELRESVIEFVDIDQLIQHPRNVNQGDVGAICESIQRNGTYGCVSVQVSTKHICRGNHTVLALQSLGYTQARVEWLDITDEEALAIMVADNRIPELAHRDDQDVANLLSELAQSEAGLSGTGYENDDLDQLLADIAADEKRGQDTEPTEPPVDPITKSGDLWILGEHKLLCGDATKAEDYDRLLEGEKVDLLLTDPPYGVGIEYGEATDDQEDKIAELIETAIPLALKRAVVGLVTPGRRPGLMCRYPKPNWILTWIVPGGQGYGGWGFCSWQPILAYGSDPYLPGEHREDTYISSPGGNVSVDHPTPKPIRIWEWVLQRGSNQAGQMVLDPFAGSGTTLIAADNLNRQSRLMEIEPGYCDVICKRFQQHTGIKPERDGVPHDFLEE